MIAMPERDLVGDHLRRRPQSAQKRVVVARGEPREDHSVDPEREHREDVEERGVDLGDLEVDHPIAPDDVVPEGDSREGDEGEENREERGQGMQDLVRAFRDEVLLGEHLDRVGDRVEEPQHRESQDVGAVRADPVLHDRGLLSLDPGMEAREVQDPEEQDAREDELDDQVFHHGFSCTP